jgi:hypothetical protein
MRSEQRKENRSELWKGKKMEQEIRNFKKRKKYEK